MCSLFLLIALWVVFSSCFALGPVGRFRFLPGLLSQDAFWRLFRAGVFPLAYSCVGSLLVLRWWNVCLPLSRTSSSVGIRSCPWPPGPGLLACFLLLYRLELDIGILCKSLLLTRACVFPSVHTFPLPCLSLPVLLLFT